MTITEPYTPSPSRMERRRRETVDEIRMHALAQLHEGGPEAVSLRDIAKRMGMTAPALYRYFPKREALLAALVDEVVAGMWAHVSGGIVLDAALARAMGDTDLPARIREWGEQNPGEWALLFAAPSAPGSVLLLDLARDTT